MILTLTHACTRTRKQSGSLRLAPTQAWLFPSPSHRVPAGFEVTARHQYHAPPTPPCSLWQCAPCQPFSLSLTHTDIHTHFHSSHLQCWALTICSAANTQPLPKHRPPHGLVTHTHTTYVQCKRTNCHILTHLSTEHESFFPTSLRPQSVNWPPDGYHQRWNHQFCLNWLVLCYFKE